MKEPLFTGVCTALVTPFDKTEAIHYQMLDQLIDRQLNAGVSAIAVCGTTGEAAALTPGERRRVVEHTARYVSGRCTVIAGTGTNNTKDAVALSRAAQDAGADGLLIVTPYYNKTTQAGLIAHYEAIANAVKIPIIVYNVPSRTGMTITPQTCQILAQIGNINGIKEAAGDLGNVCRIRNLCRDTMHVYSGSDELAVPMMAVGAKGLISTTSNLVPRKFVRMLRACEKGDYQKAGDMQNGLMPLIDAMFCEVNPIPLKEALRMSGHDAGQCRAPLCPLSREHRTILENLLPKVHIDG